MPFYAHSVKQTTFASTLTLAVDLTNATGLLVQVHSQGVLTPGGTPILSAVIDPTGANITMTAGVESNFTVSSGKLRAFSYIGTLPTGVKNVVITLADANAKPNAWALPFSGFTSITPKAQATGGGTTAVASVASVVGDTLLSLLLASANPTITATGTATKIATIVTADGGGAMALTGAMLTNPGAASVSVSATGSGTFGSWVLAPFALAPLITALAFTGTVPGQTGTVGAASTLLALATYFSGGTSPYTYSVTTGSLPPGLSLNTSTGQITGTPTTAGSYAATIRATDAAGTPATADSNSIGWVISPAPATATTLTGPSGGQSGQASASFTVGANGAITGTVTVTPSDGGGGGTFTPTSVAISAGTPTASFTYTPGSVGTKTISIADSGGLTDATPLPYVATGLPGTITIPSLKAWTGTVQASLTVPNVVVVERSTRTQILALTNQTADVSGTMTFTNAKLVAGVGYMVLGFTNDGSSSFRCPVTAA